MRAGRPAQEPRVWMQLSAAEPMPSCSWAHVFPRQGGQGPPVGAQGLGLSWEGGGERWGEGMLLAFWDQ